MARHHSSSFKDHIRESIVFSSRSIIAAVVIALLVILLISRLAWLQIFHQEHYKTLSENNRVNILPIPPTRGLIYDRNGVLLAQNLPSFTLELVPEHIPDLKTTINEI